MKPRIFVSQPVPEVALDRMREYGEVEVFPWAHREISVGELESAARRSDYVFCMHSIPVTRSMVDANPNLIGYGVASVRADLHDVEACERAGIKLLIADRPEPPADGGWSLNGYGLNPRATSDLMVTLLLNLAYRVVEADKYCRGNGYFQEMTMDLMGQGHEADPAVGGGRGRAGRRVGRGPRRTHQPRRLRLPAGQLRGRQPETARRAGVQAHEADRLLRQRGARPACRPARHDQGAPGRRDRRRRARCLLARAADGT
jgi:lactate dehydrogenase-like 2-hydroxyacid dehydrogenase